MSSAVPPQRRQQQTARGVARGMTPAQGAQEAERRLGRPCFHAGQRIPGTVGCVACRFRIRNRGVLPACPDCGELVWVWLEEGPPPVPEGEAPRAAPAPAAEGPRVEENVKLEAAPVKVEENVKLEP